MSVHLDDSRRRLLRLFAVSGAGFAISIPMARAAEKMLHKHASEEEAKAGISPTEDLMREHGVLKRVLLIYDEASRRIEAHEEPPFEAVWASATIVRDFIDDYHEKLEEHHIFPRFRKAGRLVPLTHTLKVQHDAGRRLTDITLQLANQQSLKDAESRARLTYALHAFVRMYSPHEAREDTVLFPALREIISGREFDALGEDFEEQEHRMFGEDGFNEIVGKVASIEKSLGIYDLAQFTPTL
jgi:hemerythrin-like domain-containing protein